MPTLNARPGTAFEIRHQVRGTGTHVTRSDPEQRPGPCDDMAVSATTLGLDGLTRAELLASIRGLSGDERRDIMALILMVRGELDLGEQQTALAQWDAIDCARAERQAKGISLASDYLAEVLVQCGRALAKDQDQR